MPEEKTLTSGLIARFVLTMVVVVFGLSLIKTGATMVFQYFAAQRDPAEDACVRNLVSGFALAAVGMMLIFSYFTQSPYLFASGL